MRNPARAMGRWSSRHGSRLATVGLALVLVSLTSFSLWAAFRTDAAAREGDRDGAEQEAWQTARLQLAAENTAQRAYMQRSRAASRAASMRAAVTLRISLGFIQRHASPADAAVARQAGVEHERYLAATGRLLAAVAAGDAARARAVEAREVDPAFEAVADRLAGGAQDEREQVAASLAELRRLGRRWWWPRRSRSRSG